ncbi:MULTISPECIES: asparagine synthase-related protein [unclassified Undibacterium]|uniref:asparagine synthase-related protein n=1 Tax=unclassified Undibacterium TaxID=2630295 RepID=UPI002AC90B9A|nr:MULTISPECIES: asparagine synthase-related protein [unclassified Undibacterium]MEB0140921.1 asparagine synthase-related protein [Undibacterium sp. CCC2.1]MEB0173897.1 asparagine synthase-related protein [Undibacterium sp. CCC1.1]MEB0177892.1 asparagine synthase-related protein [Undibacterium sp. CCC3.4]MEB0217096.1 asparagine synthase-related protein [Undibacterium sp. 5I2]WPX42131.1 asparagine synthase-related protein [Undibacterium sp. CCC3.4]
MPSPPALPLHDLANGVVAFDLNRTAKPTLSIAFAGRLDECPALAARLGLRGPVPAVTDLLALAYQRWDLAMPEYLLGEFSLILHDSAKQRIVAARDALGIGSLFYAHQGSQLLACARIAPLLDHPQIGRRLNHGKLVRSALIWMEPGPESFYEGVLALPGGSVLCLDASGLRSWSYWQPDPERRLDIPDREVPEALRALLFAAVEARLPAHSTPAALLSGGLDSSSLVAVAASILKKQNRRLLAMSAVLPAHLRSTMEDESAFIAAFSKVDNIDFLEVSDQQRGPFDDVSSTIRAQGKPFINSRQFQFDAFAHAATAHGAETVFGGGFGEHGPTNHGNGFYVELFRSGQWWLLAKELQARARVYGLPVQRVLKSELLRPLAPTWLLKLVGRSQPASSTHMLEQQPFQHAYLAQHLPQAPATLLAQLSQSSQSYRHPRAIQASSIAKFQTQAGLRGANELGVHFSLPLLDQRIIEFCLAAPTHLKVSNGYPRSLIRHAMNGLLPAQIQWRTSKQPFSPDFHLRYNRQRYLAEQLFASIGAHDPIRAVIDVARLQKMVGIEMQSNRCDTQIDFAAMHMVPRAIYLIQFLRQFPEFA